jgi:hypothetical protein
LVISRLQASDRCGITNRRWSVSWHWKGSLACTEWLGVFHELSLYHESVTNSWLYFWNDGYSVDECFWLYCSNLSLFLQNACGWL